MTTEEGEKSLTEQVLDFDSVVEIVPIDSEATWFDMPMAALGSRCANISGADDCDLIYHSCLSVD